MKRSAPFWKTKRAAIKEQLLKAMLSQSHSIAMCDTHGSGGYHKGWCTEPVCGSRRLWTVLPLWLLKEVPTVVGSSCLSSIFVHC
jgi:hypothetical protein